MEVLKEQGDRRLQLNDRHISDLLRHEYRSGQRASLRRCYGNRSCSGAFIPNANILGAGMVRTTYTHCGAWISQLR
jgi:hypothetical protein